MEGNSSLGHSTDTGSLLLTKKKNDSFCASSQSQSTHQSRLSYCANRQSICFKVHTISSQLCSTLKELHFSAPFPSGFFYKSKQKTQQMIRGREESRMVYILSPLIFVASLTSSLQIASIVLVSIRQASQWFQLSLHVLSFWVNTIFSHCPSVTSLSAYYL